MIANNIAIIGIVCILVILLYLNFRRGKEKRLEEIENKYAFPQMIDGVREYFNQMLVADRKGYSKKEEERRKREHMKTELRKALRNCGCGDIIAKRYVKEHIKEWLINEYQIDQNTINYMIPFWKEAALAATDKYDILIYCFQKSYGQDAFLKMLLCIENLDTLDEITAEMIDKIYKNTNCPLSFADQLEIVVQRIYQLYKGHGCIDELRDMNIDGVSGGVSGLPQPENSKAEGDFHCNSVWIFFQGRMIRLAFLGFGNEHELERVSKNIYRYGNPGQLSAAKGFMANEMKDGSRVIVVRPPFAESWSFFIRKFGIGNLSTLEELIHGNQRELPISFLNYLIKACQVFGITGEQGCGKTTLLKSLIRLIPSNYTLRVQELVFELHLREMYPTRNIVTFRETATVNGRDGLDVQKKTDGTVNILGEVASAPVASWLVMISQVASKFTIFTHHAKTAEHLIMSLRNDLMMAGGFHNETIAEEQVRMSIRFDVHMAKRADGYRFIERISEILHNNEESGDKTRDIIVFENNQYSLKQKPSEETLQQMYNNLSDEDRESLIHFLHSTTKSPIAEDV